MSALLVGPSQGLGETESPTDRARRSLRGQGFDGERSYAVGDLELTWFPSLGSGDPSTLWHEFPAGVICCVGTLFYRGSAGAAALESIWKDFSTPASLDGESLSGNYVIAIARGGRLWTFGDELGMLRMYRAATERVYCTSWLACAEVKDARRVDRIGAIDYVVSGANHGERTPVEGVLIVDPTTAIEHVTGRLEQISDPARWLSDEAPTSFDGAVEHCAQLLRTRSGEIASAFDGCVNAALSGGFDSRLILAALRAAGCQPRLHVYGRPSDADVVIAAQICRELRLPLRQVDKSAQSTSRPALSFDALESNWRFFDGIPIDGIFDRGADRQTRLEQSADRSIALNGGGGEILRNFFYLSDQPFSSREIVQAFYSNFVPELLRSPSERGEYADYLQASLEHQVGAVGRLSRRQVELAYAVFRNRFWTARNNSLAARCGAFLTPLLDPTLVRVANALPMAWKDYGRFESRLITNLDASLGRFPLVYGFRPENGPGAGYRFKMWMQHHRPPWLRARALAVKVALGRARPISPPEDASRLIPGPWRIAAIFDPGKIYETSQMERLLTLEHTVRSLRLTID